MKISIIYSSKTSNTKKVAYKILEVMPKETKIYNLKDFNLINEEELIIIGYWVDKGKPNKEMIEFMKKIEGKKVITFGTLGEYPNSAHGKKVIENTNNLLKEKNKILGNFLCQGKIDPKITEMFMKNGGPQGIHKMTEERIKKHKEAENHPNENDFKNAQNFVIDILKAYT